MLNGLSPPRRPRILVFITNLLSGVLPSILNSDFSGLFKEKKNGRGGGFFCFVVTLFENIALGVFVLLGLYLIEYKCSFLMLFPAP